jgi:hypothetical protein
MDDVLPSNIDFYRTPIAAQETPKRVSPSIPAGSALSRAAEAAAAERASKDAISKTPVKVGIYGSVSTIDIAANLKAVLAEHEQGTRVVFSPENVKFVEATEEKDRVKHLGTFEIEINLNEASKGIRRKITVNAQG